MKALGESFAMPYWVCEECYKAMKNLAADEIINLLPKGEETPTCIGFYFRPIGSEIEISIHNYYGDRCPDIIVEHRTSEYINLHDALFYTLRDTFNWVNSRYPGDRYLGKVVRYLCQRNNELKGLTYFERTWGVWNRGNLKCPYRGVVHCPTRELARNVLQIAASKGYEWRNGVSYLEEDNWDIYGKNTAYSLKGGIVGDLYSESKRGCVIVSAEQFISDNQNT